MTRFSRQRFLLFVKRLIKRYFVDDVSKSSAALAYYFVFSFFPFVIFISMVLGFANISAETVTTVLHNLIPQDIINIITIYLEHVTRERSGNALVLGFVFTLYFPMRAVNFLMSCINHAYRVGESRSGIRHIVIVFVFSLILTFVVLGSLVIMTVGRTLLSWLSQILQISNTSIDVWNYVRFFILAAILFGVLSLLYYVTPNYKVGPRYIFPGAFAALISWLTFSIAFAYYVENMSNYSVLYGSIGAIIVLIMWLYFSSVTIIMGAEFNHVLLTMDRPGSERELKRFPFKIG